jgi:hypothetical protein
LIADMTLSTAEQAALVSRPRRAGAGFAEAWMALAQKSTRAMTLAMVFRCEHKKTSRPGFIVSAAASGFSKRPRLCHGRRSPGPQNAILSIYRPMIRLCGCALLQSSLDLRYGSELCLSGEIRATDPAIFPAKREPKFHFRIHCCIEFWSDLASPGACPVLIVVAHVLRTGPRQP